MDVQQEATHKGLWRKSHDRIKVGNPTEKDYYVDWDGFKHKVPANGSAILERYLAEKYCREMKNQIINDIADKKANGILAERRQKGMPELTTYEQQNQVWDKVPSTNDKEMIKDIYPQLWLGLVEEYGLDYNEPDQEAKIDTRTPEEQALDDLKDIRVAENTVKKDWTPINKLRKDRQVTDEVAQEGGQNDNP